MPKFHVTSPDGRTVEVTAPEGATQEQAIKYAQDNWETLSKQPVTPTTPTPTEPSLGEKALNVGKEVVGAVAEPIAQMATGAIAKPVSDIAGLGATAYESATGGKTAENLQGFKEDVQDALTYHPKTQLGQAEFNPLNYIPALIGKFIDAVRPSSPQDASTASGMAINAVREAIPQAVNLLGAKKLPKTEDIQKQQALLDTQKKLNAPRDEIRNRLQKMGFVTPAEQGMEAQVSAISSKTNDAISVKNAEVASRGVAQSVLGLPADEPITQVNINKRKMESYKAYDNLEKSVPDLKMTPTVEKSIKDQIAELQDNVKSNPVFYSSLKPAIGALQHELTKTTQSPKQALSNISKYRQEAKATFNKTSPSPDEVTVAHAKLFMADKLEDMFEQNVKNPEVLQKFRDERKKLAEIRVVEDSVSPDGTIDIQKIAAIGQKHPGLLTGYLKDVSDLGANYSKGAKTVKSPVTPFSYFDTIIGGASLAAGHGGGAALVAGKGIIPAAARRGMLKTKTPTYKAKRPVVKTVTSGVAMTAPAETARQERKKRLKQNEYKD